MDPDPTIEVDEDAKAEYTDFWDLEIDSNVTFESTFNLS